MLFASNDDELEFDKLEIDLGNVIQGDKVFTKFLFTNRSNNTIKIISVKPTCGCTIADDYTHEVKPGDTGYIAVEFDSTSRSGEVYKTITVFTNSEKNDQYKLVITGKITEYILSNPDFISFGYVYPKDKVQKQVSLKLNPKIKDSFEIVSVEAQHDFININWNKSSNNNYLITIKLSYIKALNYAKRRRIEQNRDSDYTGNSPLSFYGNLIVKYKCKKLGSDNKNLELKYFGRIKEE